MEKCLEEKKTKQHTADGDPLTSLVTWVGVANLHRKDDSFADLKIKM